ncbi:MAG: DUF2917 domain-containing protein [Burkholderiales bacterium]|nr:DUF2917 domain-containing protein [Burkholderiales bacterium]
MHLLDSQQTLILLPKQTYSFANSTEIQVRVDAGRVWITAKGLPDDYWLQAGDTLSLPPSQHIVVEAEHAFARLDVLCQAPRAPKRHWWQHLLAYLMPAIAARH